MYNTVLNLSAPYSIYEPCVLFSSFDYPTYILSVIIDTNILFQNVSGSGKDMGQAYVNFTRNCMDQIRSKVNDELWILNFFEVLDILFDTVWCIVREEENRRKCDGLLLCLLSVAAVVYGTDTVAV
jgi:hypothetical protein